jgi:ribose transport system permease protein
MTTDEDIGTALVETVRDETPIERPTLLRRGLARQELTLVLVLLVVGVAATLRNSAFGTSDNLVEVIRAAVVTFIVACPLTLVTIGGGFDFSVGSVFTLGGVTGAYLMTHGVIWPLAVVVGLVAGGVVILFTGGIDISPLPTQFDSLGTGSVLGVPNVISVGVAVGIVYHVVLEKTRFGYNVRALGGNRLAATENGIAVHRLDVMLYVGAGALAAFAGIVYTARTGSGQVSAGGSSVTLTAISAVLIGGTSLFGGLGTITGTALGAVLFAEIDNALAVSGIDALYSNMIIGAILVLAVAADSLRRGRMFSIRR